MTQRTEGLVTYTEETRVTEARASREGLKGTLFIVSPNGWANGLDVDVADTPLTLKEARALRDAITVMLGDGAKPCGEECDDIAAMQKLAQRWAGERIIERLVKQAPMITTSYAANIVREECGVAE